MKRALGALALGLLLGCSGKGNTGQPDRNFAWVVGDTTYHLWEQVPWANHGLPRLDETQHVLMANTPIYPPIADGMADPGSRPVDCSGLEDIELSPYYVDTFEPLLPGGVGVAPGWSSYDDGSDASFRVPGDASWYDGLATVKGNAIFGLAADAIVGERPTCDGAPNDWAMHYRGGRFNWYGGGMAHPFAAGRFKPGLMEVQACPPNSDLCPTVTPEDVFGPARSGNGYANDHYFWDASQYDGIVFWARRGPESVSGLLVGLQDKYNSDDLARENEKFCKRAKLCVPSCTRGRTCELKDDIYRCMPEDFPDDWNTGKIINESLRELLFPRCKGPDKDSTCVPFSFYPDPDFNNTECKFHSFTGVEENYWCSTGDAAPAAAPERCGDNYVAEISVSTDWQLYKLPFDSFKQVGFGKRAPKFDLKTLYSIAFQFTVGNTDFYVDNLSLYRNKQP